MTLSSEEEEADVPRVTLFIVHYFNRFLNSLPAYTFQIVVLFCILPVSISAAIFLVTAILNFGVAFIAQIVSSLVILLFLIPTLTVCFVSGIATAHLLQLAQTVYLRLFPIPQKKEKISNVVEIEEKLKIL